MALQIIAGVATAVEGIGGATLALGALGTTIYAGSKLHQISNVNRDQNELFVQKVSKLNKKTSTPAPLEATPVKKKLRQAIKNAGPTVTPQRKWQITNAPMEVEDVATGVLRRPRVYAFRPTKYGASSRRWRRRNTFRRTLLQGVS